MVTTAIVFNTQTHLPSIYLLSNFQAVPYSKLREIHPFLYQADGAIIWHITI